MRTGSVRPRRSVVLLVSCTLAALGLIAGLVFPTPATAAQPVTWNFTQARIPAAQPLGNYGRGVLVAVVDTWVDFTQPEFGGRVVDEADCLTGSCVDHTYHPDQCVHGTHVAGTIASTDYGVAPAADILAVQVLSGSDGSTNDPNASCSGTTASVAAGIDFAVSKGARVINLSLADEVPGLFQSSDITAAVDRAAAQGVLVVFAAGNDSVPLTDNYGNSALIVAATGPSGQLASYSNYNSPLTGSVSVAAPGGDAPSACSSADCILSTFPRNQLGLLEGTSMAAPHVSGLAALLWSQFPGRTLADVRSTIEQTASPLAGAGAGLINATAALQAEAAGHPPAPAPTSTPTTSYPASGSGSGGSRASTPPVPSLPDPAPAAAPGGAAQVSPPARVGAGPVPAVPVPATPRPAISGSPSPSGNGSPAHRSASGAAPVSPPMAGKSWVGHHAGVLILACLLVVVDVLALLWTQRARRLFGG